jgi:hypothetical protein
VFFAQVERKAAWTLELHLLVESKFHSWLMPQS